MKKATVFSVAVLSAVIGIKAQTPSPAPANPAMPNPVPPVRSVPPSTANGEQVQPGQQIPPGFRNPMRPAALNPSNRTVTPFGQTNQGSLSNQNMMTIQDRAVTAADQSLLITLRQTVETTLRIEAGSPWMPVHFDINNAVVTLFGTVQTANQKQQVVASVQQTPGVARLIDQLVVGGTEQVSTTQDQALLLRVRQTVLPQIQVGGVPPPVNFSIQQGLVTITGTVPTIEQKRQVLALVQQVPGVVQVSDQTVVNPSGFPTNRNLSPTGRP